MTSMPPVRSPSAIAITEKKAARTKLLGRGFLSLLVTQFFGAANDNIIKQVVIFMVTTGVWRNRLGDGGQAYVAMLFTLPFIFFSGYGGQFADRNSKQFVTVLLKALEIPIAIVAMIGFWQRNLTVALLALVLLATHSTFFAPAKYGMIPELVDDEDLSQANGVLNMLTNIAVILGMMMAGPISDRYFPVRLNDQEPIPQPLLWLPGVVLVGMAILGLIVSLLIPKLRPRDPGLKYKLNPLSTYWQSLVEMSHSSLLAVAMAWAFFYLIAGTVFLILPEYEHLLNIRYSQTSYLMGGLALAIALGSAVAGFLSGKHIEPRLIPIGAGGLVIAFTLLGSLEPEYKSVAALLVFAGFAAGFYIIPLQALLQKLSPDGERGRFLGTANALSFVTILLGSALYWVAASMFHMPPNRVFLALAALCLLGMGIMIWKIRDIMRSRLEAESAASQA